MKFTDRLKRVFGNVKTKLINFTTSYTSNSGMASIFENTDLHLFKESLYLFIGVSMIRETISSIPLELYRIKNAKGDVVEIEDDPFLDLINRPNYRQTQKEFWKLAISYYLLAGETFWYIQNAQNTKEPESMVNLRPDRVRILLSMDKLTIVGYQFTALDGSLIQIAPEDVLHIKNIDPVDTTRGVGVIRPATQRILTEREASAYQANTFTNQGRPDIAVFTDTDLTDESVDDARVKWHKTFAKEKGSQVAFFGGSTKSIQTLGVKPSEMGFMGTMNFLRDDILAALRIPKAMITSDDVNLANSETARTNYIAEACLPVLDAFIDVLNNKYLYDRNDAIFLTYESPINEDRSLLLKEAIGLKTAGIISANEGRTLMNYETVDQEGADDLATSGGAAAQGNMFETAKHFMKMTRVKKLARRQVKKRPILIKRFKVVDAMTEMFIDAEKAEKSVQRQKNPVFHTKEQKVAFAKAVNESTDKKAENFKENIDAYNQGFEDRIIAYIETHGASTVRFFDAPTEMNILKNIFVPLMQTMYKNIGKETMQSIAKGFKKDSTQAEGFYTSQQAMQMLELRAEYFSSSMLDTDFKQMTMIIGDGLTNGDSVEQIGRNIRGYFADMTVARAKTIARTETGRLVSQATNDAYNQSEFVTGKQWITAGDDKVRPEHAENEGAIVGVNDSFPDGEAFPGEDSINCRCVLAPTV